MGVMMTDLIFMMVSGGLDGWKRDGRHKAWNVLHGGRVSPVALVCRATRACLVGPCQKVWD